jgi:hypothetical protein
MVLELCEYDFSKYDWVSENLDIYDYVKKQSYLKYKNFSSKLSDSDNE